MLIFLPHFFILVLSSSLKSPLNLILGKVKEKDRLIDAALCLITSNILCFKNKIFLLIGKLTSGAGGSCNVFESTIH